MKNTLSHPVEEIALTKLLPDTLSSGSCNRFIATPSCMAPAGAGGRMGSRADAGEDVFMSSI
jgi:hypothetical protein